MAREPSSRGKNRGPCKRPLRTLKVARHLGGPTSRSMGLVCGTSIPYRRGHPATPVCTGGRAAVRDQPFKQGTGGGAVSVTWPGIVSKSLCLEQICECLRTARTPRPGAVHHPTIPAIKPMHGPSVTNMKAVLIAAAILAVTIAPAAAIDLSCKGVMHTYEMEQKEGAVDPGAAVVDLEQKRIATPVGNFRITTISEDSISFDDPSSKQLVVFGTLVPTFLGT
jgi:hypothetical protein